MNNWISTPELRSADVWLDPLREKHRAGLIASVSDGELWNLWYTAVPHPDDMSAFIERAVRERAEGESFAFAVRLADTGKIIGSTRYMHIDAINRRVEIGHTWYSASHQRTSVNTSCKHLLLLHAFENADAIAVEFRTNRLNRRSRAAIERLGAAQDGILRSHSISEDGLVRDSAVYSVIAAEWPAVKRNLEWLLLRSEDGPRALRYSATVRHVLPDR